MSTAPRPQKVFISYAREDGALKLEKQLAILRRQGLIATWHDRMITAGREWAGLIAAELEAADIILLLVSPDFLASDYIDEVELKRALERHDARPACVVVPVILRPCPWKYGAFAKLQALPTDGEPVTSRKWGSLDAAFLSIAEGIAKAAEELAAQTPETAAAGPAVSVPGPPIWNVPYRRNPNFTGRVALLAELRAAITAWRPAALSGLGGIGKTQLALEYAWRHQDEYPVVWWLPAGEPAALAGRYASLAEALGLPERKEKDQRKVVAAVRGWLQRNPGWLLVFDNAESREAVRDYVPAGGAVLITSRATVWGGLAQRIKVREMEPGEAVAFLVQRTGDPDAVAAAALAEDLGRLPLALEQAAAYIEETGTTLASYRERFQEQHAELLSLGCLVNGLPRHGGDHLGAVDRPGRGGWAGSAGAVRVPSSGRDPAGGDRRPGRTSAGAAGPSGHRCGGAGRRDRQSAALLADRAQGRRVVRAPAGADGGARSSERGRAGELGRDGGDHGGRGLPQ